MNNLITTQANTSIKHIEQKLPDIAKYQIASFGSPLFTVKTQAELDSINQTVTELKAFLETPATASEITEAIKPIFAVLSSQRTQQNDIKLEFATWVRLLAGQPLWAINNAVDEVCKKETFRNLNKLWKEIENQTKPIVSKIKKLQQIHDESIKEIKEEQEIIENSISVEQMQKNIANAAKNGNGFAKSYLKTTKQKDL